MTGLSRISTVGMSREEWLAARKKSIGGSDAAAVVGLSPYSSPYEVWADKTGRLPDKPDNEAMRLGRDLEDYVAKRFCEATGKRVRRENAILRNAKYPYSHADVDRVILGENALLECKTTSSLDLGQFRGVEFPEKYYVQCVHYLAVTGADRIYLAVLVFGRGFFTYTLERDEAEIDALMDAETGFWEEYVARDCPPPTDGSAATTDTLKAIFADSTPGSEIELFGREPLLAEYMQLREQKKAIDDRLTEIENTLKSDLGENEAGVCGAYRLRWKPQIRRTFQPKDFAAAHPSLDLAPFYKETVSRPFAVSEAASRE